jgi:hypothetical protein
MPCNTVIRQHSFAADVEDMEKAYRPKTKKAGCGAPAWCQAFGWVLLGCVLGIALSEARHYVQGRMAQRQPTAPLRDPDTIDLSQYWNKNP